MKLNKKEKNYLLSTLFKGYVINVRFALCLFLAVLFF